MHNHWKHSHDEKTEHPLIVKHVYNVIGSGSCQCSGDCDCYKDRGKLLGTAEVFTTPLRRYSNGNFKKYQSYKACLQAINS